MSRVHLSFHFKHGDNFNAAWDVMSPDFSYQGVTREVIGELFIDFDSRKFSFKPEDYLTANFCPPEYFERYAGDINRVDQVCEQEGLMCTAWSYRIYQKAKQELSLKYSV